MLRKLLILASILCCSACGAQLKPKVMVSYAPYERYQIGTSEVLVLPQTSVRSGVSYTWRFLLADFDNTFWVSDGHGLAFTPTQAKFEVGIEARRGAVKLRLEHTCWHPVSSFETEVSGIYGGCTKVSLSYGY